MFFSNNKNISSICFDLENISIWPINYSFDLVIVVNYLYRENFKNILKLVKKNGYILYETFSIGNEIYGKPSNPSYLLKKNELKKLINEKFFVDTFYEGLIKSPYYAYKQMIVAKRVAV